MKIAIPIAQGALCAHFGHCEQFAFVDLDEATNTITGRTDLTPPPHAPGVIPPWVAQQGAKLVLAGGMGGRAVQIFEQAGVHVLVGCPSDTPERLVEAYAKQNLITGVNTCDHGPDHDPGSCKH